MKSFLVALTLAFAATSVAALPAAPLFPTLTFPESSADTPPQDGSLVVSTLTDQK
ncbi:MAG: hypothetical protein AAGI10_02595 [Pseudomonadota bacterium]